MDTLQNKRDIFQGRCSIWVKNDATNLDDFRGDSFPKKLLISLSSKCNTRCMYCPRSYRKPPSEQFMTKETIDRVIDDFFGKVQAMQIGGNDLGEQMFSPYFCYFLEKAGQPSIDIDMITNGMFIEKNNAALIVATLSNISISVEGMGKNYELIRAFNWEKLRNNIRLLVNERDRVKKDKPLLIFLG